MLFVLAVALQASGFLAVEAPSSLGELVAPVGENPHH